MTPDLPLPLQPKVLEWLRAPLEWLRAPQIPGASPFASGLVAVAGLMACVALAYHLWKRRDPRDRRPACWASAALAGYALLHALEAFAPPGPASGLQLAAGGTLLVAAVSFSWLVLRLASVPTRRQVLALGEERERALGHLRESEARFGTLIQEVRARKTELDATEARLLGFVRHAPAALVIKDLEGRFMLINPRYADVLGRPETEILGRKLEDLVPLEICGPWLERDRRVLAFGEEVQYEEEFPHPDGSSSHYLVHKFPLIDSRGQGWGVGAILTDITAQRSGEQARLQGQKLESLGILAGGLAHDFNNLLGAMEGNVELARLATARDGPVQPYLDTLTGLIARSAGLVQQILAYAGRSRVQIATLDLNRQVEEMVRLLRASLSRKAQLRVDPDPGLPLMEGDPAQVQQMIMNLVINASEAVASPGGCITIRTGQEQLSAAAVRGAYQGQAVEPGPHVFLEVADNGPGMAPEVLARIFDPFFTTKFTGRGLGLSALLGMLRAHRGGIQVRSEPGKGTLFRLLFPAGASAGLPEPAADHPDLEQAIGSYRGSGTVLVVDDEDPLRAAVAEALRRLGFQVLEARDGLEALQAYEVNRKRIRLVLMDLTMPRMDGEEAFRALRGNGMMAPVILTSGFSESDVRHHFQARGIAGFLQKPFRLPALVQMIRSVLPEQAGAGPAPDPAGRRRLVASQDVLLNAPILDQQHRQLLDLFNQLVASLGPDLGRPGQEKAVSALKAVALTHFGVEETLMESLGYPRIREHQQRHVQLIRQIDEVAEGIRTGALSLDPPLLDYLESWLVHHMQDDDRRLAQFVKAEGH